MGFIWYAIGIYIIGVAVVLFIRPKSMFRPGGTWKEFGLSTEGNYTVFPFWMFTLVWAVAAFALANMVQIFFASTALQSLTSFGVGENSAVANNANISNIIQPISTAAPPAVPAPAPAPTFAPPAAPVFPQVVSNTSLPVMPTETRLPGYYMLESAMQGPRYVYWGPEPPTAANMNMMMK